MLQAFFKSYLTSIWKSIQDTTKFHKSTSQSVPPQNSIDILQVSPYPSHAVIARPHFSANGGEASVGAALSVSDTGANPEPYDQELLALLQVRPEEPRQQTYSQSQPIQQTSAPNLAAQHQQVPNLDFKYFMFVQSVNLPITTYG